MKKHILVVTASDDTADIARILIDELSKELKIEIYLDWAKHEREAEVRLETAPYNLVITDVDLPPDGDSMLEEGNRLGLRFLQKVKLFNKVITVVLLDTLYESEVYREVTSIPGVRYISRQESDWDNWLTDICKAFLRAETPIEKAERLDVDIILHPADKYSYRIKNVGLPGEPKMGALNLNEAELQLLRYQCAGGLDGWGENWEQCLRAVGEKLFKEIFVSNFDFSRQFYECRGELNDKDKVRIRFIVERDLHPILLEAIKSEGLAEDYWMLKGPIYRQVNRFTNRYALYQDEESRQEPINIFIIQSDVESNVIIAKLGLNLKHLNNVEPEVKWLSNYLKQLKEKKPQYVGDVTVVDGPGKYSTFKDAVYEGLKGGNWHIVHYAGHSYFDPDTKTGHLFFPSDTAGDIDNISATAEEFGNWVRNSDTRFVFLSSCHSSEEDFVFELANKLVPAVVGFRWDLSDRLAQEYTKCFYEHLFKMRSIENAFLQARKDMHAMNRTEPLWASPMLVIQTEKEQGMQV